MIDRAIERPVLSSGRQGASIRPHRSLLCEMGLRGLYPGEIIGGRSLGRKAAKLPGVETVGAMRMAATQALPLAERLHR